MNSPPDPALVGFWAKITGAVAGGFGVIASFVRFTGSAMKRIDRLEKRNDSLQEQLNEVMGLYRELKAQNTGQAEQIETLQHENAEARYENSHFKFQAAHAGLSLVDVPTDKQPIVGCLLLIEDDVLPARALAKMLEHRGMRVETAATIAMAIDKLDHGSFDLVLLDMVFPDGTGDGVLDHIRKLNHKCRVAICTGLKHDDPSLDETKRTALERAMALKPDGMFIKPVDIVSLMRWIEQHAPVMVTG